ncbi:MAG: FAD-dependent thymidylate synthase [Rickettsiales bacterium]|jgi:thymidylate synthase (FAD)|nr:FAD-dependent thymidylate synthase [Rickettsiales bacterium]
MSDSSTDQNLETFSTKRATVSAIDDLLYKQTPILDKGFIRVIDYMGSDESIVQSARVSYGQGTKKLRQDQGLINYLMRHRHTTPFEMCEIKFHIKLPIFIARQWIRHRTANVNEYSARYSVLGKEFYVPERENLCSQSDTNRQGRDETLSNDEANRVLDIIRNDSLKCYDHYQEMLNTDLEGNILDENKQGLTRELARMNLTLNYYTEWYWKIDLHNLLHFLSLRVDPHAQYEIRMYAQAMLDVVKAWVPLAYGAFEDYRMNSFDCSHKMIDAINRKLKGEDLTLENSGLTKREWSELAAKFAI